MKRGVRPLNETYPFSSGQILGRPPRFAQLLCVRVSGSIRGMWMEKSIPDDMEVVYERHDGQRVTIETTTPAQWIAWARMAPPTR